MQFGKTIFVTVIAALTLGQEAQAGECMQRTAQCDARLVKVGHWVNDESTECRCFQNDDGKVICYTYNQINKRFVADKEVNQSEVKVGQPVISEQRIQELRNKYYGGDIRSSGGSSASGGSTSVTTTSSNTQIAVWVFGSVQPCYVNPSFFGHRFAYLDNRCREYVDTAAMVQTQTGAWTNRALQACQIAGTYQDTSRAETCTAIVFDNQVLRQ